MNMNQSSLVQSFPAEYIPYPQVTTWPLGYHIMLQYLYSNNINFP